MRNKRHHKIEVLNSRLRENHLDLIGFIRDNHLKNMPVVKLPNDLDEVLKRKERILNTISKKQGAIGRDSLRAAQLKAVDVIQLTEKYNRAVCAINFLKNSKVQDKDMRRLFRLIKKDGFQSDLKKDMLNGYQGFSRELDELQKIIAQHELAVANVVKNMSYENQ